MNSPFNRERSLPPIMNLTKAIFLSLSLGVVLASAPTLSAQAPAPAVGSARQDPRARQLLDEAKAKLQSLNSLVVDFEVTMQPTRDFRASSQISLERPNRYRVGLPGQPVKVVCDGKNVNYPDTNPNPMYLENYVAYSRKVRPENFFLGANFLVQFFFDPRGIAFDPTDETWGRPISQFDTNLTAYDKSTKLTLVGKRTLEGKRYSVVEIKYNTSKTDIRQQIYVGEDKLVARVDTWIDSGLMTQRFQNFRENTALPPETWHFEPAKNMPVIETDPVRMGEVAPDFTLPGPDGGEISLKELLKNKKGVFVCVVNGERTTSLCTGADKNLEEMILIQEIKDKYEKQGLSVVCIVGGPSVTPDVKDEMLRNWMPDLTRFNYPIALDLDLERGIQGATYTNFQLNGRNSLLLDSQGRVVYASKSFKNRLNLMAFYQALAQIGFSVSAQDLESSMGRY